MDRYLVWNLTSEPASWDPTTNSASIADYMCTQMFEGLTYPTVDGFEPGVAETWDVSEDGLTYTFHLRDNAKWSDGSPVTAHDFEYSWKRICDPAVASDALQAMTDYVQGAQEFFDGTGSRDDVKATAIDDYTFEVTLKNRRRSSPSSSPTTCTCPSSRMSSRQTARAGRRIPPPASPTAPSR